MYRRIGLVALLLTAVLSFPEILPAQYTLVLKNGRRITAQTYREEGHLIKIYGIGGEIGIPRAEVQSILRAGEGEGRGLDLRAIDPIAATSPSESQESGSDSTGTKPSKGTQDPKAKEEEEYRKRVEQITQELRAARDRYLTATRGTSSPDPTLLETEDTMRARNDDLNSRLRDRQHNPAPPADAGPVKLSVPSPFTGQPPSTAEILPGEGYNTSGIPIHTAPIAPPAVRPPPPTYSDRERELSDLRNVLNQLVKERERLIEEMKQKNLDTANLFTD
jgi:hypothetical protein